MKMIEIRNRFSNEIIVSGKYESIKDCLEQNRGADLWEADLREADLREANLREADLWGADLRGADLRGADLRGANLRGADLREANLRGADLRGADLREADLANVKFLNYEILPQEGAFIAWKKCADGCVLKIEITEMAKRHTCITSRKCRAEYIKVLKIWGSSGRQRKTAKGWHNPEFTYRVGEIAKPDQYDPDPRVECSNGIHFFITRKEAEEWG